MTDRPDQTDMRSHRKAIRFKIYLSQIRSVHEKIVFFFTIHSNPSLAYIAVRELQSSQRNASVQSLLLAGSFCTTNDSRVLARERWQTFGNSWKKTQYLIEGVVYVLAAVASNAWKRS